MKKIAAALLLCILFAVASFAQSTPAQQARQQFNKGNYSDAEQLYELAASFSQGAERESLYEAARQSNNMLSLLKRAESDYRAEKYESAIALFDQILSKNPSDPTAKRRKQEYALYKDDKAWSGVEEAGSYYERYNGALAYLESYPEGLHTQEANEYVAEEALWNKAKREQSYASYQSYIEKTRISQYKEEAVRAMYAIEDAKWKRAQSANTEASYIDYLQFGGNCEHKYNAIAAIARLAFDNADFEKSLNYFEQLETDMSDYDKAMMAKCEEYILGKKLIESESSIEDCRAYLERYSEQNQYRIDIEHRMLLLLCLSGEYEEANLYAKTAAKKRFVRGAKSKKNRDPQNLKSEWEKLKK